MTMIEDAKSSDHLGTIDIWVCVCFHNKKADNIEGDELGKWWGGFCDCQFNQILFQFMCVYHLNNFYRGVFCAVQFVVG